MNSRFSISKSWYLIGLLGVLALPAWAMVGRSVAPGGWSAKGGTESGRGLEQRAAAPAYAGVSPRGPSVGWDALTESGGAYEDERESGRIIPWEPDDDVDAMGGLRAGGDLALYDNGPCAVKGGPGGDGTIDLNDILGVLDAFGGNYACSLPAAGGGWTLTGNGGTNEATDFLGTTDNVALNLRVNNQRAFRLEPNAISPNVIGGFSENSVGPSAFGATIGGGGSSGFENTVTGNFATVGGGESNIASGNRATVGGGYFNAASAIYATVGGGFSNTASDVQSTVGGGRDNTASGIYATVGGGHSNTASGFGSTVAGGGFNQAGGTYSFAGGLQAIVRDDAATADADGDEGTFIWADATFADFRAWEKIS